MGDRLVRKGLVVGIIVLFIGASFASSAELKNYQLSLTSGKTVYVDDDNTEGPWDGSIEHPYQNIQDGIVNAIEGDMVYVFSGNYYEIIGIWDKSIDLIGEDKNTTVINGEVADDYILGIGNGEFDISVKVSGFTFQNATYTKATCIDIWANKCLITDNVFINSYNAINLAGSNNIISNNKITNMKEYGIYVTDLSNTISNNEITNTGFGILLVYSFFCLIINNFINNVGIGIDLVQGSDFNKITQNVINKTEACIHFLFSNHNSITYNDLSYSDYGIFIEFVYGVNGNIISYNNFYHMNKLYAINSWIFGKIKNIYYGNYWGKPLKFPKPIPSTIVFPNNYIPIPTITFDWHPAKKPNDIGV